MVILKDIPKITMHCLVIFHDPWKKRIPSLERSHIPRLPKHSTFESMIFRPFPVLVWDMWSFLPGNGYSSRQLIRSLRQVFGSGFEFDLCPRDGGSSKSASGGKVKKQNGFLDDVTREEGNSNDKWICSYYPKCVDYSHIQYSYIFMIPFEHEL